MRKIAVTGSIASGKSTVCSLFDQWGAYVVSADTILHDAFSRCEILKNALTTLLGNQILEQGNLSRQRIADIIFQDDEKRNLVEKVCHEVVFTQIKEFYQTAVQENKQNTTRYTCFVAEVPLLFESPIPGFISWFDVVVYVDADPSFAHKRFLQRGGSDADFWRRQRRFLPDHVKKSLCHFYISNNGSLTDLENEANDIFKKCL